MEKVTIYHATTGAAIQRRTVDARGMVACGEYRFTPIGTPDADDEAASIQEADGSEGATSASQAEATSDEEDDAVDGVRLDETVVNGVALTPLGEPVRSTQRSDASPSLPYVHPQGYTKSGQPDKRFKRP
jgi:hypothetical protein